MKTDTFTSISFRGFTLNPSENILLSHSAVIRRRIGTCWITWKTVVADEKCVEFFDLKVERWGLVCGWKDYALINHITNALQNKFFA